MVGGFAAFLLVANLAILAAIPLSRIGGTDGQLPDIAQIKHLRAVDDQVWRGDNPAGAHDELAERGVTTVVDLRAEAGAAPARLAEAAGVELVSIPMQDGRTPTAAQVAAFRETIADSPGITYVHCEAGVGRTGTMAAAYLVGSGQYDGAAALERNFQVGPPSLEQIVFAVIQDDRTVDQPPDWVVGLSRVLDAPRVYFGMARHAVLDA